MVDNPPTSTKPCTLRFVALLDDSVDAQDAFRRLAYHCLSLGATAWGRQAWQTPTPQAPFFQGASRGFLEALQKASTRWILASGEARARWEPVPVFRGKPKNRSHFGVPAFGESLNGKINMRLEVHDVLEWLLHDTSIDQVELGEICQEVRSRLIRGFWLRSLYDGHKHGTSTALGSTMHTSLVSTSGTE